MYSVIPSKKEFEFQFVLDVAQVRVWENMGASQESKGTLHSGNYPVETIKEPSIPYSSHYPVETKQ
jgi:hypothetical protein